MLRQQGISDTKNARYVICYFLIFNKILFKSKHKFVN